MTFKRQDAAAAFFAVASAVRLTQVSVYGY